MSNIAIKVENVSKQYRLGEVGTGTLGHDLNRMWARLRGKQDPYAMVGETNDRTIKGKSDFVWSLKDVNFEVKQGEVLGIIGRNGAGKSTLLKILSKITAPTSGQIKIKGRIASLLEVGTGFHPELTGRENVFLNGAILGMTKLEIKNKFDEIVDFSGVERYIDTPVKRYSSGMYVRLAFAVSAFLEPEILIVDEVLAVGDAEFQKRCLGRMQDVSKNDGRTVLFVSHNMAAVASLSDRICYFNNGCLIKTGGVKETIDYYLSMSSSKHTQPKGTIEVNDADFYFIGFELKNNGIGNVLYTSDFINFVYSYIVKREIHGLRIGFDITDALENVIFRSFHDDLDKESSHFLPGTYESSATIQANLLREGTYFVRLKIGVHNIRWIIDHEIEFEFNLSKIDSLNANYNDERPGMIMPVINWNTKQLSPKVNE